MDDGPANQERLKAALREFVDAKGTHRAAAAALDFSQPRITQILNGDGRVSLRLAQALARETGRTLNDLTGGSASDPDTQHHPPDDIPPADRRPVSHDATRTSRPELRNHVLWPELEAGARAKAAETGRVFPEWAWDATARAQLVITGTPDVAGVYDLVKLHFEKGWGRPRDARAETGVVKKDEGG